MILFHVIPQLAQIPLEILPVPVTICLLKLVKLSVPTLCNLDRADVVELAKEVALNCLSILQHSLSLLVSSHHHKVGKRDDSILYQQLLIVVFHCGPHLELQLISLLL